MIVDLLLLTLIAALAVRGWSRGVLREGVDVVGLVLGVVLAFRAAPALAIVISALSGMTDDEARLVGGIFVFAVAVVGVAFVGRSLDGRMELYEPGPADRGAGAGLGAVWSVFLATVLLTLASLSGLPPVVEDGIESSAIARTLVDPKGVPQAVFGLLAGDRIIENLLTLQDLFGERRVVIGPDDSVEIPAARPEELRRDDWAAGDVFTLLNRARVDAGLTPLAWSEPLAEVAHGHARDMYLSGFFSHQSPTTGGLADRLREASITYRIAGENLALAATPGEVHRGLMDSPGHRANILGPDYRRVGIAVVSGRLGLMTVQVFTG